MTNEIPSSKGTDLSLGDLLRLATSEPDADLLLRYAKSRSRSLGGRSALTPAEIKWIETNLSCNPLWQLAWRATQNDIFNVSVGRTKRLIVGAAVVLSLLSAGWLNTLQTAGLSARAEVDNVLRNIADPAGTIETERGMGRATLVVASGWNLSLMGAIGGVDSSLSSLESRYAATDDPFQKGEIAYWIANLNEGAGKYEVARRWYDRSVNSRSMEYRKEARLGAERMRRRAGH
ncbi:MAG: hypothetical protein HKN13_05445 [Rhodothermales bacterium]|nr:hypothetical protein [Rhodothermales bacterium]